MKRKICSILLALAIILLCAVPAAAAPCRTPSQTLYSLFCFCLRQMQPQKPLPCPGVQNETADLPAEQPPVPQSEPAKHATENKETVRGENTDFAAQVAALVNEQRAANGLPALEIREDLADGALLKAKDLHDSRYFDHNSPNYGTPFEMMRSLGITYTYAGENIAKGYSTPESVVTAWMNSEGHRANILSPSFTKIGVGYVADGGYWVQWFLG